MNNIEFIQYHSYYRATLTLKLTGAFFFPTLATLIRPLEDRRPPSRPPAGFVGAGVTGAAASSS